MKAIDNIMHMAYNTFIPVKVNMKKGQGCSDGNQVTFVFLIIAGFNTILFSLPWDTAAFYFDKRGDQHEIKRIWHDCRGREKAGSKVHD
jgi:hypothetical protein